MKSTHSSRRRALDRLEESSNSDFALLDSAPGEKLRRLFPCSKSKVDAQDKTLLKDKKPLLALASLLLLGGIGITLAYGSDTIFITDREKTKTFSVRTTHQSIRYNNLTPGDWIEKTYFTTNTGQTNAAVRYFYISQWLDKDGEPLPLALTREAPLDEDGMPTGDPEPELVMDVWLSSAQTTIYGQKLNPWKTDYMETKYCADKVAITDPENYSCTTETDDPTQAYSAIVGPITYFAALTPGQTTATNPFRGLLFSPLVDDSATTIIKECTPPNQYEYDFCENEENFYEVGPGYGKYPMSMDSTLVAETKNDSPYLGASYYFTVRVESIESYRASEIWATEEGPIPINDYSPDVPHMM